MKLATYLKNNELNAAEFAGQIDVHEKTVYRYLRGARIPNRQTILRIKTATKGQVTANDFFLCDEPDKISA